MTKPVAALTLTIALLVVALLAGSFALRPFDDAPAAPAPALTSSAPIAVTTAASAAGDETALTAPPSRDAVAAVSKVERSGPNVVRIRLVQNGAPLANVAVRAYAPRDHTRRDIATATTGDDGVFTLPVAEVCHLVASGDTVPRGFCVQWIRPSPIDRDLGDVHVPRCAVITGFVRGDGGQPVADATVTLAKASDVVEIVRTDAGGAFRIERVHPGGASLCATAADYVSSKANLDAREGEVAEAVLDLKRGRDLHGRVRDWRGEPLAGAEVKCDGVVVRTDNAGTFVLRPYNAAESVWIEAAGHRDWFGQYWVTEVDVQLERAVTLRGTVRGHGGAPTRIDVEPDYSVFGFGKVEVAADGTFVVEGMEPRSYVLVARTEGVGASPPLTVDLQNDATVELVVAVQPKVAVTVHDEAGDAITDAQVVIADDVAQYPSLFVDGDPGLVKRILDQPYRRRKIATDGGGTWLVRTSPMAFAVTAPGYLPAARAFTVAEPPERVDVVLQRAGQVRGVVRGGSATAYSRSVSIWRVEDDARMRALPAANWNERFTPHACDVDVGGRFAIDGLEPGAYRAAVTHGNRSSTGHRPDEQVGAVATIDEGADLRAVVEFAVAAADTVHIELVEVPLGTLRGRVLHAGQPFGGALVVAARPGWRPRVSGNEEADWDNGMHLGWVAGQRSAADGTFTFFYRDAGDVELRVRDPHGHSTSLPTVVALPSPGPDVECTVVMPGGAIRGRFPLETLSERDRKLTNATLFPMHKSGTDPYAFSWGGWDPPLTSDCASIELDGDGRFAFESLPAADFVLRVHRCELGGERTLWQRVIPVRNAPIEVGDLAPPKLVNAQFVWTIEGAQDEPTAFAHGSSAVLLREHGADPAAVWVASLYGASGKTTLAVEPGRYTLRPVDVWQRPGSDRIVDVAADGSVTPSVVTFPPPSAPQPETR